MKQLIALSFLSLLLLVFLRMWHPQDPVAETQEQKMTMEGYAKALLEELPTPLKDQAVFPFEDEERKNFHYTPYPHEGLLWSSLSKEQREQTEKLLQSTLSPQGFTKAREIMELEKVLRRLEKRPADDEYRHPERYYLSFFGQPSETAPWGWRFEGHHLSLNFTALKDQTAVTPAFFGANPARVPSGPEEGKRVLEKEEDVARQLMAELSVEQREKAIIAQEAPREIITGNDRQVSLSGYAGIPYEDLTDNQQRMLEQLLRVYLDNMKPRIAQHQWQRIEKEGLDKIHFAWAGPLERGQGHYYRIHGPTLLIEYDNTQNNANHIHTVWRDPDNDFGEDLLRQHYETGNHH